MKISVITVCYNSAETIQDTLTSIASQDYPDVEHIVIDGGSKDDTLEMVNAASSVKRFVSEPDNGIYDAMNKGIAMATGDIVGTLNADDFYIDNTVLSQVANVFSDPSVDVCYADLVYVYAKNTSRILRYWQSRPFEQGLFKKGWMPAHPTFFVRREVYEQWGNFNLDFPRQADFELTMRFLEINQLKSVYIPRVWVRMRAGGASNNSIRGIIKGNIEAYHACKLHRLEVGPFFIARKIFSRIPQFFRRAELR
ncbi:MULTISPECIES: glycosyltransferase family 2 protein [unclassified Methylophilus]|uniref:glycosyltransferase family 2 protein n=1 Tax=unclassified Methylophilus TaxID=2630143 RepID=UPI000701258F|nr:MULTISPECIES: glycosyltransferase family 2 protein [unclassified Methylophilus]KQT37208.1 family 2 glycosyl transferase [Methylophilus sp. Leaf416]KQT55622.1 family 2 glycosyl transferase [Methylophilus sp. Leaf459]